MVLLLVYLIFLCIPFSEAKLSVGYYSKTCPDFEKTIRETVLSKQQATPTTAAGLLRLFFHDCFHDGCDASVLISSTAFKKAERDAEINLSLSGDAFDVIVKAKTALELSCPGVVSCADIEAQATRDLVKIAGGPFYEVPLGRKDSLVSRPSNVDEHIPKANMSMNEIIDMFGERGFSVQETVALMGAHTLGFAHCKEFMDRISNPSRKSQADSKMHPKMHPELVERLRKLCANYTKDPTMSAFNDVKTPSKFDNVYYKNILSGLGLLSTDQAMIVDNRTKPFVELYANNQEAFFTDFARAMEKLGEYGVKVDGEGEVRNRCDAFNHLQT